MSEFDVSTVESTDGTRIAMRSLGTGEGVIVVGGALRRGDDYLSFARGLADAFRVHVVDRRGRGESGPLGGQYSMSRECEDLAAVAADTGATRVFGHSYGGLVALQGAARGSAFSHVVVYEPAVSVDGSIPVEWLSVYERLLAVGDARSAFAHFVRGAGHGGPLTRLPTWYVRLVLRLVVRGSRWQAMEPLLGANLAEHREVARLDGLDGYEAVAARVLLLAGSRSPRLQTHALQRLEEKLPHAALEIMDGLDHLAPDEKAPQMVAARVLAAFAAGRPAEADAGAHSDR
jgi:pimeloyl-ACP methyl ester carboxylesterase